MGRNGAGLDRLKTDAPGWDRFAHWRRGPAIALLITLALLMVLAALDVIGAWGWLGVIPLLAGLFRYCPLYSLLGISSCSGSCKR